MIKLTGIQNSQVIYINPDRICAVVEDDFGEPECAGVYTDCTLFRVKQSVSEVLDLIRIRKERA